MAEQFDRLLKEDSFTLQRISPKTNPGDVITFHIRAGDKLTDAEQEGIRELVRGKHAFRCRIAKGRWHYGTTAAAAIVSALGNKK